MSKRNAGHRTESACFTMPNRYGTKTDN